MRNIFTKAERHDIAAIKQLARLVIETNYSPFLGDVFTGEFINSGASDAEIDSGFTHCIVAKEKTQIIGFSITNSNCLHLMMIAPAFQRKGHGTKLLAFTENLLFKTSQTIQLQSFSLNHQANAFYKKNEWTETGKKELEGTLINFLLFEKSSRNSP